MPAHDDGRDAAPEPTRHTTPPAPQAENGTGTLDDRNLPPTAAQATASPPANPTATPPAASRRLTIGSYEVLDILGRGGMGVVYRARHRQLGHEVALKMILNAGHAGQQELARFRLEAAAVARLHHAGIVHIHDFGEHDGQPFFSLELVEGGSLATRLKQGPLASRDAAALVEQLARAVQHAHERGILHRDLKPANVLLTKEGEPKVTDFGLAKQLNADEGLSQTGHVLGTPSYMAPEQAAGRVRAAGPATDVYALGAVLYECLTGQPPLRGTTPLETMQQVLTREPVPPRRLNPAVPRDLETVCLRCLEKEAGKRYQSAADLADDLGRFLRGEPVAARPVGTLGRTWRWCRRNPAVVSLLGAVAAVLLLGATVATFFAVQFRRETEERHRLQVILWVRPGPEQANPRLHDPSGFEDLIRPKEREIKDQQDKKLENQPKDTEADAKKKELAAGFQTELDELKKKWPDEAQIRLVQAMESRKQIRTDWKIVKLLPDGQTAYINLGQADNVTPQLTFSIHGIGPDGRPEQTPKGSLEVVTPQPGHVSEVRIIQVRDKAKSPILEGDVLYNPTWSPTQKKHVAIAGVVDLQVAGRNGLPEFIRYLERHNVVVDCYLDLNDLQFKRDGKKIDPRDGITVQTEYLILGPGKEVLSPGQDVTYGRELQKRLTGGDGGERGILSVAREKG